MPTHTMAGGGAVVADADAPSAADEAIVRASAERKRSMRLIYCYRSRVVSCVDDVAVVCSW